VPCDAFLPNNARPHVSKLNRLFARIDAHIKGLSVACARAKRSCHRGGDGLEESIAYRRIRLPAALAKACERARSHALAARTARQDKEHARRRCGGSFQRERSATVCPLRPIARRSGSGLRAL